MFAKEICQKHSKIDNVICAEHRVDGVQMPLACGDVRMSASRKGHRTVNGAEIVPKRSFRDR